VQAVAHRAGGEARKHRAARQLERLAERLARRRAQLAQSRRQRLERGVLLELDPRQRVGARARVLAGGERLADLGRA
jgi:hypothetical protein